jgi:hypothetical protein
MHAPVGSCFFHETFADTEITTHIAIPMAACDHRYTPNHGGFFVVASGERR